LEQTYGLINGLGLGIAAVLLARRTPVQEDAASTSSWTKPYAIGFILLVITYLNLDKDPGIWVQGGTVPSRLYGLSALSWFNLAYAVVAAAVLMLLVRHQRQRIALVPLSEKGKGQLLLLAFLWWIVLGNFERSLGGFTPQRLITEGVIHFNAVVLTVLVLFWPASFEPLPNFQVSRPPRRTAVFLGAALLAAALSVVVDWATVRHLYHNQFAGHSGLHIRFGPNATATKAKPASNLPHP
jgi:hypothetical protein